MMEALELFMESARSFKGGTNYRGPFFNKDDKVYDASGAYVCQAANDYVAGRFAEVLNELLRECQLL